MENLQNEVKIEKLPEIIKSRHGYYHLIERTDACAIYAKDKPVSCYEVFKIRKIDPKKSAESFEKMNGRKYDISALPDIKEKYPKDDDFGKTAWTYKTLSEAVEKFKFLCEIERKMAEIKDVKNPVILNLIELDCDCKEV
jgi:hypothetical protein